MPGPKLGLSTDVPHSADLFVVVFPSHSCDLFVLTKAPKKVVVQKVEFSEKIISSLQITKGT
jgi:hypothetical protein